MKTFLVLLSLTAGAVASAAIATNGIFLMIDNAMVGSNAEHLQRTQLTAEVFVSKLSEETRIISCRTVGYQGECVVEDESGLWEIICDGLKSEEAPTCWLKSTEPRIKMNIDKNAGVDLGF